MVLFTTHYQVARLQVLTVALPEDKGTAIFRTLELQNSVTSKNTLIFYHHNARIEDTVNCARSKSHQKFISKSGQKTQYRTQSVHSHTQINKYPKKQMQTRRTKRPAVAMERKLANPWCKTHKSVHYIQCHSDYSRTKSIQDVTHHRRHHPFTSIYHLQEPTDMEIVITCCIMYLFDDRGQL